MPANAADITQTHKLLHGKEDAVYEDSGYTGLERREEMANKRKLRYLIAEKPSKLKQIRNKRELKRAERQEHATASLRAKVEHPFRVIKRQFGYIEGGLSWPGEEHGAGADAVCAVEPVAEAKAVGACLGGSAPVTRETARECAGNRMNFD